METTPSNTPQRRRAIGKAVLLLILLFLFGGFMGFYIPYAQEQESALNARECNNKKDSLHQLQTQTARLISHMQTVDNHWGSLDSLFHLLESAETSTRKTQLLAQFGAVAEAAEAEVNGMKKHIKGELPPYVAHEEERLLQLQKRCSILLENGGGTGGPKCEKLRKKVAIIAGDMDTYLGAIFDANGEIQGFLGTNNRKIQEEINDKVLLLRQKLNRLKNF